MNTVIQIGAAKYTIRLQEHLVRDMNAYGLTKFADQTIDLEASLRRQPLLLAQTLLHEVNHAALHETGLSLEREDEERVVDSIALTMTLLLQQNKKFRKLLLELIDES